MTPHASEEVIVAVPEVTAAPLAEMVTVMFAGQTRLVGGVASTTVTVVVQDAVKPAASTAVNVIEVVPTLKVVPAGTLPVPDRVVAPDVAQVTGSTAASAQLSEELAIRAAVVWAEHVVAAAVVLTVIAAGHMILGA